ncbi:Tfp pilus assembly protein PilE [uncultured Clostridium sp.]|uniref:PulJ/GspJ family protein n=1 Tax=uncultured Clostridium sp. TaxID=59620 RepID=UPI000821B08A|nr:prepilin-type N-terminal cleavage/methylation domain-containing protein [uncultured Clostridium sp.]SCK00899.1 Tfp pilus assembly protein PilE [uncultured Clostridium sp.]
MNKKASGFTVLELIITLALTTMIMGVAYTFFFTNSKTLSTTEINTMLQTEAENIEKSLLNLGTEAKKIIQVNGVVASDVSNQYSALPTDSDENENYKKPITNLVLEYDNEDKVNIDLNSGVLTISIIDKSGKLVQSENVLSDNVKEIKIRPLDIRMVANKGQTEMETTRLEKAPGLEFDISLAKKKGYSDVKYDTTVLVKFRNR